MRRLVSIVIILGLLCAFAACGRPAVLPEGTAEGTTAETPAENTTAEPEPDEEDAAMQPSYALSDTHFYVVGRGEGEGAGPELFYAELDNLEHVRRMPLPVHYNGKWLGALRGKLRIDKVDSQWIYITALTGAEYNPDEKNDTDVYVQLRVDLDTFSYEFLGENDTLPEIGLPQAKPPMDEAEFIDNYHWRREEIPRPPYEITASYAKTPAHIFAARGGQLYRMPLNDIAQQQLVALPKKFDTIQFCGVTEQWLFVCGGQKDEDGELRNIVTYRIPLDSLKAEQIDESKTRDYPRYNAAGNSLLYISEKTKTVEALSLDTRKRSTVFDFSGYYLEQSDYAHISGWFNTPRSETVLQLNLGWFGGWKNCLVFGENNAVRMADILDLPLPKTQPYYTPSKAEQGLKDGNIVTHAACGDYVYYVENAETEQYENNLYRVKANGSEKKLLRAKTNIYDLMAINGKLVCLAGVPNGEEQIGFYALDENGQISQTIDHGFDGEWAWNTWERRGDLILFTQQWANGSEDILQTLYSPATGAVFYAYEKESD